MGAWRPWVREVAEAEEWGVVGWNDRQGGELVIDLRPVCIHFPTTWRARLARSRACSRGLVGTGQYRSLGISQT